MNGQWSSGEKPRRIRRPQTGTVVVTERTERVVNTVSVTEQRQTGATMIAKNNTEVGKGGHAQMEKHPGENAEHFAKQNPLETAEVGARRHREEHSFPVPRE